MANLFALLRRLEVAIPVPVEIDHAELYRIATVAHAQMSCEDLELFDAVSLFMKERPGETLFDCYGLLTSEQRRAISRYARAVGDAELVRNADTAPGVFL